MHITSHNQKKSKFPRWRPWHASQVHTNCKWVKFSSFARESDICTRFAMRVSAMPDKTSTSKVSTWAPYNQTKQTQNTHKKKKQRKLRFPSFDCRLPRYPCVAMVPINFWQCECERLTGRLVVHASRQQGDQLCDVRNVRHEWQLRQSTQKNRRPCAAQDKQKQ